MQPAKVFWFMMSHARRRDCRGLLMADYRRWLVPGATYFFTVVTYQRRPILASEDAVHMLGDVMRSVRKTSSFHTIAMAVLPDHIHCVWSLPPGDLDFSTRWKKIKRDFTLRWTNSGGTVSPVSSSRVSRGEHGVWQRRFWEHLVRDEADLEHCCDYIHYNPVKHGYAASPADWPWSTFAKFVESGSYPPDWGRSIPDSLSKDIPMGE
jgi:putative transposase